MRIAELGIVFRLAIMMDYNRRMKIEPITSQDCGWVRDTLEARWHGPEVVSRGKVRDASLLAGFIARTDTSLQLRSGKVIRSGEAVGLITYEIVDDACEIVTLDSLYEGLSIGSGLVNAVRYAAEAAGCRRLWLITTNDNTHAMHFYQKRGFRMIAVHAGAVDESRNLKPAIPLSGSDGIPIHDEVEFELKLMA